MKEAARHLAVGADGEEAAARYILRQGWRILDRNWRPEKAEQGLELDLVARQGDTLIFVEVKTRTRAGNSAPAIPVHAAFTRAKQAKLVRAARRYLTVHELWRLPCRFDLICAEFGPDGRMALEHHHNVIELGHSLDCGDPAWQPW